VPIVDNNMTRRRRRTIRINHMTEMNNETKEST
jgi:hypothetical protein